jgi:hypothetical protein
MTNFCPNDLGELHASVSNKLNQEGTKASVHHWHVLGAGYVGVMS